MIALEEQLPTLNLESGRLCLDFANTADWHASDQPGEMLNSYHDLVTWAGSVGVLTESEAHQCLLEASQRPEDAAMVLKRAITFREALFRIFSAVSTGDSPKATDLAILNEVLSAALGRLHLVSSPAGFSWDWHEGGDRLEQMLWPVAQSAADLLTSAEISRVGRCADERCGWLFMDMSKNRSRRWCDMKDCGNRAKARRHYRRKRTGQTHPKQGE